MIPVTHRAFHLFREDAYREYCWSVDAYGAYQPASFIYLCYESFYELCAEKGIKLVWPKKPKEEGVKLLCELPQRCEKIDINSCLNKLRSVAEMITRRILEKNKLYKDSGFSDSIGLLQSKKLLSSRAIGYLHTVRVIGNLASHPFGNKLTETDVLIASFALASVMEEVIGKYAL